MNDKQLNEEAMKLYPPKIETRYTFEIGEYPYDTNREPRNAFKDGYKLKERELAEEAEKAKWCSCDEKKQINTSKMGIPWCASCEKMIKD